MPEWPTILIGVPLYEGWEHVGETLASIQRQTYRNFRVLISVDGGDRRSYDACRDYMGDPRFEIMLHERRLNWDGNMTWLGEQLREDYFCYWQHDDYCDPNYLRILVHHARRHPEAAAVYCDIQAFGTEDRLIQHPSVKGFALQRVLHQLAKNNLVVIRCLVRADAMRASLPIRLATTWSLALARAGELHRVPKTLYFRRFRPDSYAAVLRAQPAELMWRDSIDWGLGVMRELHPLIQPGEETQLLLMVVDRLVNRQVVGKYQYDFAAASTEDRLRFIRELLEKAHTRFGLVPFPDLLAAGDPASAFTERRARVPESGAEALLIEAILSDLPKFRERARADAPPPAA